MGTCNLKLENNASQSEILPQTLSLKDHPQTSEGRRWKSLCEKLAKQNMNQRAYIAYLHDSQESQKSNMSLVPTVNVREIKDVELSLTPIT